SPDLWRNWWTARRSRTEAPPTRSGTWYGRQTCACPSWASHRRPVFSTGTPCLHLPQGRTMIAANILKGSFTMKTIAIDVPPLVPSPATAPAARAQHSPAGGGTPGGPSPAFSAAVESDGTLYISGTTDGRDPATGQKPADATAGAKVVLNNVKKVVE